MAESTGRDQASLVLYEVFVRNHGPKGTFREVEADLPRIRALGVDFIWLMPVHPVGKLGRKGSAGSPYSVRDYYRVDPAYGTLQDFSRLVRTAHQLGLKVMMDVVFNHTAPDCALFEEHPEWFYNGASNGSVLAEWTDVIGLNHHDPGLREYLVQVLCFWAEFGIDGFRCDVACFLPLSFWVEARKRVEEARPGLIWLAESAGWAYVAERRAAGLPVLSDNELYEAFDLTYDHDGYPAWCGVLAGGASLASYAEVLRTQNGVYPANFVKLRFVENHDRARIMALAHGRKQAMAWTAFQAFQRGAFLIYAGQESGTRRTPSLFEREPVEWGEYSLAPFLSQLAGLKRDSAVRNGTFTITAAAQTLQAAWQSPEGGLYGIFDVNGHGAACGLPVPDGEYDDALNEGAVEVRRGACLLPGSAAILRYREPLRLKPFHSPILDYAAAGEPVSQGDPNG